MSKLDQAITFAVMAHVGQKDKHGLPAIFHPLSVMIKCDTEEEMVVAVLHDVLEDTDWIVTDLDFYLDLSQEQIDALISLTRRAEEKYEDYIQRVKRNKLATKVKLKDLEHNLSRPKISDSLIERYIKAIVELQ